MIRAVLLDCGGVMVAPATGDWMLSPGYEAILGEDFAKRHLSAFRRARRPFLHLLPDANCVDTDEAEHAMFIAYLGHTLEAMGITLTQEALSRLAWNQVYRDERYLLFDDIVPMLDRWAGRYLRGIVSDAPPSTRRILQTMGVMAHIDAATFSCDLGVLKPGAAIYQRTLAQLGVAPEEAVFVDDMPEKLRGAQALGIRGIQMLRPMPALFAAAPPWDGPVVRDMASLDALLARMA